MDGFRPYSLKQFSQQCYEDTDTSWYNDKDYAREDERIYHEYIHYLNNYRESYTDD